MNFKPGVFLIQASLWLVLLAGGFGFANQYFGLSDWEFIAVLSCLGFSAFLVDENFALSLLPIGHWAKPSQKK